MAYPLNLNGYGYTEYRGSPQESYVGNELKVCRYLDCDWGNRWQLCRELLGVPSKSLVPMAQYVPGVPVYAVHRKLPHSYRGNPLRPLSNKIYATNIESIEPISLTGADEESQAAGYTRARLKVNYETLTYAVRSDDEISSPVVIDSGGPGGPPSFSFFPDESRIKRFVTKVVQPAAETLTLSNGAYRWVDNRAPLLGAASVIISTAEVHYIWHQVPGKPSLLGTLLGTVNLYPFDNFPTDTLLLLAAEVKPYRTVSGVRVCDITYKMKYFQAVDPYTRFPYSPARGHNHFLKYRTIPEALTRFIFAPTYEELTHNGYPSLGPTPNIDWGDGQPPHPAPNGIPVYRRADFRSLFNPDDNVISNITGDPED